MIARFVRREMNVPMRPQMKKTIVALVVLTFASIVRADDLTDRVAKIASSIDATVGVSAVDLSTGRTVAIRGDERFPMASVYKLVIAEAFFRKATKVEPINLDTEVTIEPDEFAPGQSPLVKEAKGSAVSRPLGRLVVLSLGESDNTASDALLKFLGGPEQVGIFLRTIGVSGIDVSRSEKQIAADVKKNGVPAFLRDERDTSTPDAMRLLLRMMADRSDGVADMFRKFELEILAHSTTGKNRMAAGVPDGATVYGKTGTAWGGVVNEAALIYSPNSEHRIAIAIFTKGGKATEKEREAAIAKITAAIYGDFTKRAF